MNDNFEIILSKYFSGTADEADRKIIDEWKAESEDNRKEFERYRILWEKGGETTINYTDAQVESALNQTKKRISDFRRTGYFRIIRQAAAILIVSLLLSSLYNYFGTRKIAETGKTAMKEIVAFNGMATRVNLPDGTVVDLFPGSKLSFPVTFSGDIRKVHLTGEGFFSVVHNKKMPFIVEARGIEVRVLGTKFDVKADPDENYVETMLVEGSVRLEKDVNGKDVELKTLKPGERAVYCLGNGKVKIFTETNIKKFTDWTNGTLVFDADPIDEVVKKLEKWYDVDIIVKDGKLKKYKFTGVFHGESIDEVLVLLKYSSDFRYKILKAKEENGKMGKRKIILTK